MQPCLACGGSLPEQARFCPACGAPVEAAPSEERKLATVLFADLVGSTEIGGVQDPERTRATLDLFYDAMAAEIRRAGGTVEKFVGDAVMAVFGAPAAQEDHVERALHAALAMRRRLRELFGDELRLRIGVNTGEVVVGRAREGSSFVTGDAVNVCARLEQNVSPGEILVGERAATAARGAFEFDEPTRIAAKGKHEGVACRRLVRALTLMRPRGVRGLQRVFVGREEELELLRATVKRAIREREPHLVTIMGDPGVGKSRLVRELWEWLGGLDSEPLRRTGRCLPYGHGITYWPLGEVLKEHLGIVEDDSAETMRTRLGDRQLLGLTLGLDVAGALHPLEARDRLHEAWIEFLESLANERPTVMLIEDLHWAEEPLLDLLQRIVRDVHAPLLVLGTARPELLNRRPTWGGGTRNASLLWLEPLSSEETVRMLDELLAAALPERLQRIVVEHAEGNPFFVEELIATLLDHRVLERENGSWRAHEPPEGFSVPDSIQAVLAARIDLLPPLEKSALQAAAVIGRVFWEGPVRELLAGAEPDFALLEERDFIRHRSGSTLAGEREYAIKHALTRQVAYASVPKARRARLHAAFADLLERADEGRGELAALLAHHYASAVAPEDTDLAWGNDDIELDRLRAKAVLWLRRAAELAVRRFELDDALALLARALEFETAETTAAEIWRVVGHAHALRFDGEAFWTAMQRSLEVCSDRGTRADTYSLLAFYTAVRVGMWKSRPKATLVTGWIERALELSEPDSPARARALLARAFWDERDEAAATQALELAHVLDDVELESWALAGQSGAAIAAGRFADGWTLARRRFDLVPSINDPDHVHDAHEWLVSAAIAAGRLADARHAVEQLSPVSQRLSPHHRLHAAAMLLEVEEVSGGWREIREHTAATEEAVTANLDTPCVRNARSLLVCAAAWELCGDVSRARALEERADALGMQGYDDVLAAPRIRLELSRRRLDRVEEIIARTHPEASRIYIRVPTATARFDGLLALRDRARLEAEAPWFLDRGGLAEPFAARALGVVREDDELVRRAHERFEALGLHWQAEQTRSLLGLGTSTARS